MNKLKNVNFLKKLYEYLCFLFEINNLINHIPFIYNIKWFLLINICEIIIAKI